MLQKFRVMKFGKRLASEAARRWRPAYLDYKALKRAIEYDVQTHGEKTTSMLDNCCVCYTCSAANAQLLKHKTAYSADAVGQRFNSTLQHELQRVNKFYSEQEHALEVSFACYPQCVLSYWLTTAQCSRFQDLDF